MESTKNIDSTNSTNSSFKLHNILEKKIFNIFFNLSRINIHNYQHKTVIIEDFFSTCQSFYSKFKSVVDFFINIYRRIILYTRDIYFGFGERTYSYLLLLYLHKYFPEYTENIIKNFLFPVRNSTLNVDLPIGSWCDIKYLPLFIYNTDILSPYAKENIINMIVRNVNIQLHSDLYNLAFYDASLHPRYFLSNVAKWIPRERKKSILYKYYIKLADDWTLNYDDRAKIHKLKKYRTIVSDLNSIILTFESHKSTYYPLTNKNQIIHNHFNFRYNIQSPLFYSSYSSIAPGYFVKNIQKAIKNNDTEKIDYLNTKWGIFVLSRFRLSRSIPVVDMTIFHKDLNTFYDMIGIAIYLCYCNFFGKRILIASDKPIWLNLENCKFFSEYVSTIMKYTSNIHASFSNNTNSALRLINESYLSCDQKKEYVKDSDIVIFAYNKKSFIKNFTFDCNFKPNIIFWNIGHEYYDLDFMDSITCQYKFITGPFITNHFFNFYRKEFTKNDVFTYFFDFFSRSKRYTPEIITFI
jgi:hypothetical protein